MAEDVAFTGDSVLGEGSVFVAPDPGALRGYLEGLERLRVVRPDADRAGSRAAGGDPGAKLDEYIAHRLDRERRLVAALASGLRKVDELLDAVVGRMPRLSCGRPAVTLAAHLDKLEEEGRLPESVERPVWDPLWGHR